MNTILRKAALTMLVLGVYAIIALLATVATLMAPYFFRVFRLMMTGHLPFVVCTAVLILLVALFVDFMETKARVPLAILGIAWIGFCVYTGLTAGYHSAQKMYAAGVTIVDDGQGNYELRTPYEVAKSARDQNVGDIAGVDADNLGTPRHVGDTWTNLVQQKSRYRGYSEVMVREDDGTYTRCAYEDDDSGVRFGGRFGHNLGRPLTAAIVAKFGHFSSVQWDKGDVFGTCVDGKPVILIPLTQRVGHWYTYKVPAGTAMLDSDGSVTIPSDLDVDGPLFPISLAEDLRESTYASGSWWSYLKAHRDGYEPADSVGEEGNNVSEFALQREDGTGSDYLTALTRRAGSQSIVAVSAVDASTVTPGALNPLVIHDVPDSAGLRSRLSETLATFQTVQVLATKKAELVELAPVKDDEWVATLGIETQGVITPMYRITIPDEGDACLSDFKTGTVLQCGALVGEDGNGPSVDLDQGSGGLDEAPIPGDGEVGDLSTQEILALLARLTRELQDREDATAGATP